jgi:hypothetical protein
LSFDSNDDFVAIDMTSGPAVIVSDSTDPVNGYAADPTVQQNAVNPVSAFTNAIDNEFIGRTLDIMIGGGSSDIIRSNERAVGNLVADAQLAAAQAVAASFGVDAPQVGIANGGGIRSDLPAGLISVGDTFDVSPFGNFVSVIEDITTADLKLLLENAYSRTVDTDPSPGINPERQGGGTGRFAQIAGMSVEYDISRTPLALDSESETITTMGSRIINATLDDGTELIINGVPVPGRTVDITLPSFNADGGDQYFRYGFGAGFYTSQEYVKTLIGVTDQQALQSYIEGFEFDAIDSDSRYDSARDGRIVTVSDRDNDGVSDAVEALIGTDPDVLDQTNPVAQAYIQAGQDEVTLNPPAFTLYTQEEYDNNRKAGQDAVTSDPFAFIDEFPSDAIQYVRPDGVVLGNIVNPGQPGAVGSLTFSVFSTPDLNMPFEEVPSTETTIEVPATKEQLFYSIGVSGQ